MQDRQHHAVLGGVGELVGMPARGQRPGLGLAVADDRCDEQVRVVERGAVGVRERVAELAALVDRARRLRSDVRRDAAGEGELPEQPPHALDVLGDVGVDLRIRAVEVGVGDQAGTAVAGAGDVDRRLLALLDRPVEMRVEEVEAGRGAPVAEQSGLDVVARQRGPQQRVVQQVDLPDRQVVRGAPPAVELGERLVAQRFWMSVQCQAVVTAVMHLTLLQLGPGLKTNPTPETVIPRTLRQLFTRGVETAGSGASR